jgi:type VI protein secretion system component Hcp
MHLPDTTRADTMSLPPYEEVDLVFTTIEWDWKPGGVVASDEWIASR